MIVYPALDLREGCCVQLVGGSYDNELLRIEDPIGVALNWKNEGFDQLHIIDLDRATNNGSNVSVVKDVITKVKDENFKVRVGGGIRTTHDVKELIEAGASSIVIGSQGIRNHKWLEEVAKAYPKQVYIAIEVFEREVKVDGWQTAIDDDLFDLLNRYENIPLAGIFVTAIHKEGLQQGTDVALFKEIVESVSHNVVASGGVTNVADINELTQVGASEVVLGAALYSNENFVNDLQAAKYIGRQ